MMKSALMVKQLTAEDYDAFIREKQVAALHFDCIWDGYRQSLRETMQQAEEELGDKVNFGEIDCDQNAELARSLRVLNVPTVVYYSDGFPIAVLGGGRQNVRGRLERLLRGETIGYKDGLDDV